MSQEKPFSKRREGGGGVGIAGAVSAENPPSRKAELIPPPPDGLEEHFCRNSQAQNKNRTAPDKPNWKESGAPQGERYKNRM